MPAKHRRNSGQTANLPVDSHSNDITDRGRYPLLIAAQNIAARGFKELLRSELRQSVSLETLSIRGGSSLLGGFCLLFSIIAFALIIASSS